MKGWVKLHRKIQENDFWTCEKFTRGQAWVDLILLCNHQDSFYYKRGVKIDVGRGQLGRSVVELSDRWKWSRSKVTKFLNDLEKEQQIKQQKSNITLLITVINYDLYQSEEPKEQQTKQQKSSKRAAKEQQKDIYNNDKKDYNDNNEEEGISGKPQKPPKPKIEFIDLGEFENIKIEKDKFELLTKTYPAEKLDWMIKKLGGYLVNTNKKTVKSYKSLKGYFVSWVDNSYEEQKQKQSQNKDKHANYNKAMDELGSFLGLDEIEQTEPETQDTDFTIL